VQEHTLLKGLPLVSDMTSGSARCDVAHAYGLVSG